MSRACVVLALLLAASSSLSAQRAKRCTGDAPDSVAQGTSPVYRDCDVDRTARIRGSVPRLQMGSSLQMPRDGCFIVEYEFVVDTLGRIEDATIKLRRSDDRNMEEAVRASLSELDYMPALIDKRPVRQVVVHRVPLSVMVRTSSSGAGGRPPAMPAGSCR